MPVILETNHNRYFHRSLYDELHLPENTFTHIEWPGIVSDAEVSQFLGHIFNSHQANMVADNLGRNLHLLRSVTSVLLSSAHPDFLSAIRMQDPDLHSHFLSFHHRVNAMYLSPETQYLLDKGDLDFHIRHALASFVKMGGEAYAVHAIGEELKGRAVYKALMDVGILYPEKHTPFVNFSAKAYWYLAQKYLEMKPLKGINRLEYWIFTLKDAFIIRDLGMNKSRRRDFPFKNPDIHWDTDLYYDLVGRRADPVSTGLPLDDPGRANAEIMHGRSLLTTNVFIRKVYYPIYAYLNIVFQYPYRWMGKRQEIEEKGLEKTPPAMIFHKYMDEEKHVMSDLPSYGMEARLGLTKEEERRTMLRQVYLQENPDQFGKKIKWRHVRRFLVDAKHTVKQHYIWQ